MARPAAISATVVLAKPKWRKSSPALARIRWRVCSWVDRRDRGVKSISDDIHYTSLLWCQVLHVIIRHLFSGLDFSVSIYGLPIGRRTTSVGTFSPVKTH